MTGEIVAMTNVEYWTRWALAGALFLTGEALMLHYVVVQPLLSVLSRIRVR